MKNYIIYCRVSSQKQIDDKEEQSGLGLKAQRQATMTYIYSVGGVLLKEFKEVQSASNVKDKIKAGRSISLQQLLRKRVVLLEALEYAKQNNAIIVVKEVTRLTRFRLLGEYIFNSGVPVICADYPGDNSLILSIKIALGQEQAEAISTNTKAAIQQRIITKGNWNRNYTENTLNGTSLIKARQAKEQYTSEGYKVATSIVCSALKEGCTLLQTAFKLNGLGLRTTRGNLYTTTHIIRIRNKYCKD